MTDFFIEEFMVTNLRVGWVSLFLLLADSLTRRPGWCSGQDVTATFLAVTLNGDLTFQQVSLRVCGPLPNETTLFAILASFFTHLY